MEKVLAFFGVAVVALVFQCLLQCPSVSGCTERDRLVRDLTQNYMTSVEPDKSVLKVGLSFLCSRFEKEALVSNVWEKLTWTDKRLRWLPEEYNGISLIRLPSHLIWTPDLKLYNSLVPTEERDRTNVVVFHDGSVIFVPPALYRTRCAKPDADEGLSCQFKIGSWTYDADTLKLELDAKPVDASEYQNSTCPLVFKSATAEVKTKKYDCCDEPYSHIQIDIKYKK